jgi:hypothetical protein
MRTVALALGLLGLGMELVDATAQQKTNTRSILVDVYVDKMKGGWAGQMVGVGWGGPTEFKAQGRMLSAEEMPDWTPEMVNQFQQDDLYVEMTFLETLERYGLAASSREAGLDFANSRYPLWHANDAGRTNLRTGIAPPDSGHPQFNHHADDIDYQIEADFSGLIAPGLPNLAIRLGETFGRLMNYGDGLYGGQFVGGMYAEAFFETSVEAIVRAGLACIPRGSQYHECISDVLAWHAQFPDDWTRTWEVVNKKYHLNPDYRRFSCSGPESAFNIDAKLNGAYIVMGLLYGERDIEKTIAVSTRCGQDSDCNPSSAAGILCTTIGFSNMPSRYTATLDAEREFLHTDYNFTKLVKVCEALARQAVKQAGGKIAKDAQGREVFVIPVATAKPLSLEQCWDPGPPAGTRYTQAEMAQLAVPKATPDGSVDLSEAIAAFAPGWTISKCGWDMDPGLRETFRGHQKVLVTHPRDPSTACRLTRQLRIPEGAKAALRAVVSHHPEGDWTFVVKVDSQEIERMTVGPDTVRDGWLVALVDLAPYAGRTVTLELLNEPSGWMCEAGYWASIAVLTDGEKS